jgi:hypothetical protein
MITRCVMCSGTGKVNGETGLSVCPTCAGAGLCTTLLSESDELEPIPPGPTVRLTEEQFGQFLKNSAWLK